MIDDIDLFLGNTEEEDRVGDFRWTSYGGYPEEQHDKLRDAMKAEYEKDKAAWLKKYDVDPGIATIVDKLFQIGLAPTTSSQGGEEEDNLPSFGFLNGDINLCKSVTSYLKAMISRCIGSTAESIFEVSTATTKSLVNSDIELKTLEFIIKSDDFDSYPKYIEIIEALLDHYIDNGRSDLALFDEESDEAVVLHVENGVIVIGDETIAPTLENSEWSDELNTALVLSGIPRFITDSDDVNEILRMGNLFNTFMLDA